MKKTVFLATTAMLGTLMAASTGFAATYTDNTATTDAKVAFEAPKENPDKPVTPGTDPENPDTPDQPGNNGNDSKALLKLVWATDFDFGSHTISSKQESYAAQQLKTKMGNYIPAYTEVSDKRAVQSGWHLAVKQDTDFTGSNNNVLKGASLKLVDPTVSELAGGATSTIAHQANTVSKQNSTVMDAKAGTMPGNYFASFAGSADASVHTDNGVSLDVPANAALADTYKTTLTWTLTNAPEA